MKNSHHIHTKHTKMHTCSNNNTPKNTCMQQQHHQQQKHMHTKTTTTIKKEYLHLGQSLAIAPILPLACGIHLVLILSLSLYSFIIDEGFISFVFVFSSTSLAVAFSPISTSSISSFGFFVGVLK